MSSNPPDLIFLGELQAREHLSSLLPANSTVSLFSDRQHHFQSVLDSSLQSQIKASVSLRDRARINTISAPFAGSWIRATPNSVFGLTMSPQEFVVCVHLWLGISLFPPPPSSSRCFCGSILDCHGDHVLGCHSGSTRIKRHDTLCDIIFHCLQANNSGTRREQHCCSDNQSRPGDIFHPDFLRGRPAYFDLSAAVRNSLQQSFIVSSAITAGSAASAGEMEKDLRHQLNVESTGSIFYPLVVESLGLWSSSSLEVLKDIARKTTLTSGQTISKALTNLHERLSVCLWKNNGRMLLDRLAVSHNSDLWDTLV